MAYFLYLRRVSVLKAHLLTDLKTDDDAEKYDGVAALLEGKDGSLEEMLDSNPVSSYQNKLMNAAVLYLVLPLDKVLIYLYHDLHYVMDFEMEN